MKAEDLITGLIALVASGLWFPALKALIVWGPLGNTLSFYIYRLFIETAWIRWG